MTLDSVTRSAASAVVTALSRHGRRFDTLTHAEQLRFADGVDVPLPALSAAIAQLTPQKGKLMTLDTRTGRVTGGEAPRIDQVGDTWVGDGPEGLQAMLADSRGAVWSTVLVLEERLGVKATGSRVQRYERVTKRLEKLRKASVRGKLSDADDAAVDRYRRRLKAAEDAFVRRETEATEALSSLARQAEAVRAASKMVGA